MRASGRLSAAIQVLDDFFRRPAPLKTVLADWARDNRYAGAKDRAWISGLCLDALRRRNSLAQAMGEESARALALGVMGLLWRAPDLAEIAAEEPHGPGALTQAEAAVLLSRQEGEILPAAPLHMAGDFPEWLSVHVRRAFGARAAEVMAGFAARADIDLRLNVLKTEPEKALKALKSVRGEAVPILTTAARIAAPPASERAAAVTVIPAFNKGWVEVQDLGSQIAAAAAGNVRGAQVLDYCAGGGGKTLALAAMMENAGQLYAYDRDARRLKPLYHRARRAGVRNLQIRSPSEGSVLDDLKDKMDVVFVDAPCTGAGTWRRHPDTKWRLTPQQLERRMAEQDAVLAEAAAYVKPGGRMVWATCSFLMEENEDRLAAFFKTHPMFEQTAALASLEASALLTPEGRAALEPCATPDGALRLTPDRLRADGFFVATLVRSG